MTTRPTEARNPATLDLDTLPTREALARIVDEDAAAVEAVRAALPAIAEAVELANARLAAGGRLHYVGAGASGRLAVLDATELTPTFGVDRSLVTAHFPGGAAALVDSALDFEDSGDLGAADVRDVTGADLVLGITASGATRYVAAALGEARRRGASTVLISCSPDPVTEAGHVIVLDTGPEALTGSTRLKAGTATKVALNAFSTALMARRGRVYSNLMIGMSVTNEKLRERAVAVVRAATGRDEAAARAALSDAGGDIEVALVALLSGAGAEDARTVLAEAGSVRAAVARFEGRA